MSKTIECLKMLRVSIEIDADKVIQNYCNLKLSEHTFLDTEHDKHQHLNLRKFIKLMMLSKQINLPLIEVENHKIYALFFIFLADSTKDGMLCLLMSSYTTEKNNSLIFW